MPDTNHTRIDELIQEADDPISKATLMLISRHESSMGRVVVALDANTKATQAIEARLSEHTNQEEIFQTRIETSWRAGAWVASIFGAAVVIVGGALISMSVSIWNKQADEAMREAAEQRQIAAQVRVLEARLSEIERKRQQ